MSSPFELIDSHCHLNYDYDGKSAGELVSEAGAAGVSALVAISVEIESHGEVVAISEKFANVFHTVGLHPHEGMHWKASDADYIRQAARHPKCRGIGELGLDYHYESSPRHQQLAALRAQLDLAIELEQPIVVHSREAEDDLLPELTRYAQSVKAGNPVGVIHCFTGTKAFGQACLDLGFYISFSGILTFKNAEDLRDAARAYPLERILVETDSPFLAPIPYRGKKGEPRMVFETAKKLAEVKGLSFEEVAKVTTANSKRLFRLP
ncbi:MAG: TatD family hydrolase [Cryobacterium sp.]|nr:TatD family hydrolase [Oligoflexia bacterium]